ncbi:MAG: DinB family protein [Paenibacillus dendritiformis]|uniref:DinB family protein n=1 Tax=Paenibacillus dendritiformis TaxID=130049 RepID=UPI00143D6B2E|nr:DinB family protein [Paenibacillus dendritiformis]MDU5144884.1 DinB family protein [Paenibacillus dendritiformis]NKI20016.1 DinB family protein [Paenibacillus dendritiformis]NRG00672.1 DinB family protein [Paenibacillus dendritiformis]
MNEKSKLLDQFGAWNRFVLQLANQEWHTPIDEGKWTIHDIVSHIMMWDKYFYEEAIYPIANGKPVTVSDLDFDAFNREAVEYGKTLAKEDLIALTTRCRNLLLETIARFDDDTFSREYAEGKFTVRTYLEDFIWHDRHHMAQIEEYRRKSGND